MDAFGDLDRFGNWPPVLYGRDYLRNWTARCEHTLLFFSRCFPIIKCSIRIVMQEIGLLDHGKTSDSVRV